MLVKLKMLDTRTVNFHSTFHAIRKLGYGLGQLTLGYGEPYASYQPWTLDVLSTLDPGPYPYSSLMRLINPEPWTLPIQ